MRKFWTFIAAALVSGSLFAGGLVTNTNQSAMFTRMQNRNASTSADAVYFNPAGLTKLGQGFFASISNQTIGQTKTVYSSYTNILGWPKEYVGKVSAPVFPSVYAVYNTGKFSFSAGFNPVGGGGGAKYEDGLPSFEMNVSNLVPYVKGQLAPLAGLIPGVTNITGYKADIFFEGTSVYFGYQANVAYAINDNLSVALGGRLISAKNTYSGHVKDIFIYVPTNFGGTVTPGNYFRTIASLVPEPYKSQLNAGGTAADAATAPVYADVEETGSGFTPIISANYTVSEKLNVALKYEFQTKLELTTKVKDGKDAGGMFEDGKKSTADMPAMLSLGAEYRPLDKLMLSASFNTYFDKAVDYDGSSEADIDMIDKNFLEYGLGAEYSLSDNFRVSAGWVATSTGVNLNYQSDQTYSTNTNSFGAGFGYRITPKIDLNLGGQYTIYDSGSKDYVTYWESYNKKTWIVAVGLDFSFGK